MEMSRLPAIAIFALAASLLASPAFAQAVPDGTPATRDANTWNNREHAPGPAVTSQEQAAGVALPPAVQRQQTDEVERLQREILQRAQQGTADGVMDGSAATQPTP